MGVVLENGVIESDEEDEKVKVPAGMELRVPPVPRLLGEAVSLLVQCGYDVSIEQIYSDSFAVPKLDHYAVLVHGRLNITEEEQV